jgi:hypothetical protein
MFPEFPVHQVDDFRKHLGILSKLSISIYVCVSSKSEKTFGPIPWDWMPSEPLDLSSWIPAFVGRVPTYTARLWL